MAAGRDILARRLRRLAPGVESERASDAALLGRFVADRDEAAFATLVERHGPLVLHVCRRVLGDAHDADDAFQATFLVLARKAGSVRPREALAGWLHGVARRVALKARSARARRLRAAGPPPGVPAAAQPDPFADLSARELLELVDDEVQRLPPAYRLPVLLCCLEGRTQDEAARQLGWTPGSVKGRLERGRARLHARLVRRGLTLSAALAASDVSRGVGSPALVAQWTAATVRAALAFAAGPAVGAAAPTPAAVLARQVVRGTALARLKLPAALVLATCLLAAGFAAHRPLDPPPTTAPAVRPAPQPPEPRKDAVAQALARDEPAGPWPEAATHRVRVSGRVLDPAGRPFAGARLYIGYAARRCDYTLTAPRADFPVRGTTGADGRFDFAFTRSELDERYLDASRPIVVAWADGFGLAWAELGDLAPLDLRLVDDLPIEGRILDQAREPVAGAAVSVREVICDLAGGLPAEAPTSDHSLVRTCRGPLPGHPPRVTTDADGRFRLTGLGRDRLVVLTLDGPGVRHSGFTVATTPDRRGRERFFGPTFEYAAASLRAIRGVVRDRTTGRPVAGARLSLFTFDPPTVSDADGRYELHTTAASTYVVTAQPQREEPLFAATRTVTDRVGPDPLIVDLELAGGIPLRGRVTDQTTGKPLRRAVVTYYPVSPNPHAAALTTFIRTAPSSAAVRPDGSFALAVLPGPGVVFVSASPRDLYASAVLDDREWAAVFGGPADPGGGITIAVGRGTERRGVERFSAIALIRPDERAESVSLDLAVRPAHAVRGTVAGPDGAPLAGVRMIGLTAANDPETLDGATFTVEGLNPRGTRELIFQHRERGLGKVVTVRGDASEPLWVRLDPCGVVTGRMVDKAGKPAPGVAVSLAAATAGAGVTAKTDADGRFRATLIPGLQYSATWYTRGRPPPAPVVVEVEPGRTKDLGDLFLDR